MSPEGVHFMVLISTAIILAVMLQFAGPLLMGYHIGEKRITVTLFHLVPVLWITYNNLSSIYDIGFPDALSLQAFNVRNRMIGRTVRIEKKNVLIFHTVDITPTDPAAFVTCVRQRIPFSDRLT